MPPSQQGSMYPPHTTNNSLAERPEPLLLRPGRQREPAAAGGPSRSRQRGPLAAPGAGLGQQGSQPGAWPALQQQRQPHISEPRCTK